MNRTHWILVLLALSLGTNVWLVLRKPAPAPPPPASSKPEARLIMQESEIDYSGTGLSDESWKLQNRGGGNAGSAGSGSRAGGVKPADSFGESIHLDPAPEKLVDPGLNP